MNNSYKSIIYPGRFQGLTIAHISCINYLLDNYTADIIVLVGSCNIFPTIKNPFSYEIRKGMIKSFIGTLSTDKQSRIKVMGIEDSCYDIDRWKSELNKVGVTPYAVAAYEKDVDSWWVSALEKIGVACIHLPKTNDINATNLRELLFREDIEYEVDTKSITKDFNKGFTKEELLDFTIAEVAEYITSWRDNNIEEWTRLKIEYNTINKYRQSWKNTPYPVNFVCVDALVTSYNSDNILLIRRKDGTYALPGGFVETDQTFKTAVFAELQQETGLTADNILRYNEITDTFIFDAPHRDLRGRIITRVYNLTAISDVPVVGGDDATHAGWYSLEQITQLRHLFYSDHYYIIGSVLKMDLRETLILE